MHMPFGTGCPMCTLAQGLWIDQGKGQEDEWKVVPLREYAADEE